MTPEQQALLTRIQNQQDAIVEMLGALSTRLETLEAAALPNTIIGHVRRHEDLFRELNEVIGTLASNDADLGQNDRTLKEHLTGLARIVSGMAEVVARLDASPGGGVN